MSATTPNQETAKPVFNIPHAEYVRLRDFPQNYPVVANALIGAFRDLRALSDYVHEVASLHPVTSDSDHADELAEALNEGWSGEWDIHDRSCQLSPDEISMWASLFHDEQAR
jgi:hypothetical protein